MIVTYTRSLELDKYQASTLRMFNVYKYAMCIREGGNTSYSFTNNLDTIDYFIPAKGWILDELRSEGLLKHKVIKSPKKPNVDHYVFELAADYKIQE